MQTPMPRSGKHPAKVFWLELAGFATLLVAFLRRIVDDQDIFFHLTVGRQVARTLALPEREFYVLPLLGEPGSFHEWGFGLAYHLAERAAGLPGMALLNASLGALTLLFLYRAALAWDSDGAAGGGLRRRALAAALLVVAYSWAEFRFVYRPEDMLYLAIAAEIWALERFLATGRRAWLALLPVIALVLTQFHPSALFLLAVFSVYAVQAIWQRRADGDGLRLAPVLLAVAVATALAACVSPYGWRQLLLPLLLVGNPLIGDVTEFLPALDTPFAWHFVTLAMVAAVALLFGPARPVDWLLAVPFGVFAYLYARNVPLLALVAFVPMTRLAFRIQDRIGPDSARGGAMIAAVALAGFMGAVASGLQVARHWGIGILPSAVPAQIAEFLRAHSVPGNLLNFYDHGSYLAWALPGRPVFVDGRNYGTNRAVQWHDDLFTASAGWERSLASLGIHAISTRATLRASGQLIPLTAQLAGRDDWILAVREPAGLLFVERRIAAQLGIASLPKSEVWRQVLAEARSTLEEFPGEPGAHVALARAHAELGDAEAAARHRELAR